MNTSVDRPDVASRRARKSGRKALLLFSVVAIVASFMATTAPATPAVADVGDCASLETSALDSVIAISSEVDDDGEFTFSSPFGGEQTITGLPAFCRVQLTVDPAVNIEVWLPVDTYNGRFQAVGGGGYAGNVRIPSSSLCSTCSG